MLSHRAEKQFVRNRIEIGFDVEVEHPGITPAALSRNSNRIQCRFPRPVSVRVGMEVFLQFRLKIPLDHRLGDSIGDSGNSQWPESASSLLDVHTLHRRREVTAGRHPIPEFVEIVCQVPVKLFDRLIVHSGCTPVRLYPFVSIPNI
jgi:hypothetical protein